MSIPCRNLGRALTCLVAPLLCVGCGAGVAAVVAGSGSSDGGNSAPSIANLQVPVSRTSPAEIRFELSDREGEAVRVGWQFTGESFLPPDGRFVEDMQLIARLSSGTELVLGDDEPFSIGNTHPSCTPSSPCPRIRWIPGSPRVTNRAVRDLKKTAAFSARSGRRIRGCPGHARAIHSRVGSGSTLALFKLR